MQAPFMCMPVNNPCYHWYSNYGSQVSWSVQNFWVKTIMADSFVCHYQFKASLQVSYMGESTLFYRIVTNTSCYLCCGYTVSNMFLHQLAFLHYNQEGHSLILSQRLYILVGVFLLVLFSYFKCWDSNIKYAMVYSTSGPGIV